MQEQYSTCVSLFQMRFFFTSDVTASQPMAVAVLQSVTEMSIKYGDQPC